MRSRFTFRLAAVLLFLFLLPAGARGAELANGTFEKVLADGMPSRWLHTTSALGYTAEAVSVGAIEGQLCVRLSWTGRGEPTEFGNLMQTVDARPYRGKRVRFRAAVRAEGGAEGRLWIRVDRESKRMGLFENMEDRPIVSPTWSEYEIVGNVEGDATHLTVGFMLRGSGSIYVDDASLEIVGDAPRPVDPEAPRPLTAEGLANVVAFARLFGVVRHFHPSDEAANADWERIAVGGVKAVERAKNAEDLSRILEEIFLPVAPSLAVYRTGTAPPPVPPAPGGGRAHVRAWRHQGYGQGSSQAFESSRVDLVSGPSAASYPSPRQPWNVGLGAGVSAQVPLAVYADESGTLPPARVADRWSLPANRVPVTADRATRLATVVIAWNVLQHFYPYFDVVEVDWTAALHRALAEAATDTDEVAFLGSLRRLAAALHDGGARVIHEKDPRAWVLPLRLAWIENQLVVRAVEEGSPLAPGDVVEAIDGKPVDELRERLQEEISGATAQWIRQRLALEIVRCETDAARSVRVRSFAKGDEIVEVPIWPQPASHPLPDPPRPAPIVEIEPGIWYVDTTRFDAAAFRAALPDLAQARGLAFDFRGYPGALDSRLFLSHLTGEEVESPQWLLPIIRRPDRRGIEFASRDRWKVAPAAPYLPGRKVFLIDGGAISYAESCLGIVEAYNLGELIGEPTAGTEGNVNTVTLPGGYRLFWTGMRVHKHDDSPLHGVGVRPTIPAAPTRAGVAAGRDEMIERALTRLRG